MGFLKYFFILLIVVGSGFISYGQMLPPNAPQPLRPHGNEISPDTLLKEYSDSVRMKMMAGDYQSALRYCTLRIRKTPFHLQFMYYDRAQAETYLGMNEKAIRDYDTVIGLDSFAGAAYMNQAYLYMQAHKTDKAFKDYDKGFKVSKDSALLADMHLSRGNAYLSLKQTKEAEDDFTQALTYNRNSWQAWLQRGSLRRFAKDISGALQDLNVAYRLKPTDPDVLLLRGVVLYENGMYPETVEDLNRAIKFRKNNDTWYYLGMAEMNLNQDSLAREHFTDFLKSDPKNTLILTARGNVNYKMKHPLLAIKDYTKVIELKPKSGEAYANRAYVYSAIGNRDKACVDLHKAASLGVKQARDIIKKYCGG